METSDSEVKMFLMLRLGLLSLFVATLCSKAEPVPIPQIVAMAKPCVIQIVAFDEHWRQTKSGTGFFISSDGLLLTNYHVIEGATFLGGRTAQGAIFILDQVISMSRNSDLALLKFRVQDTPFLKLGSSANAVEGQKVLVIGNPEGFQGTVSDGIIAAFRDGRSYIQITASVSPDSSGAPVLDESGQVIGLATLVYREGQNLNFAISSETIRAYLTSDDAKRQASQGAPPRKQQENSAYNSQTVVM